MQKGLKAAHETTLSLTIAGKWKFKPQKYRNDGECILGEIIMQSKSANW